MANCPNCGYKLKMTDWRAECPKCSVNLIYYNHQERLAEDADKAEEEHIKFQPKLDRVKFAFAGTKLSILRIILILVPIGMLFLPLANINCTGLPHHDIDTSFSMMSVINDFEGVLNFGTNFTGFAGSGLATIMFFACLAFTALIAVVSILNLIFCALSCSPVGFKRNVILSSLGCGFAVLDIICFVIFNSQLQAALPETYSGSIGIGAFLAVLGFLLIIGINVLIKKQNVPVKYKDLSDVIERMNKRKAEIAEMEAKVEAMKKAKQNVQ